MFYGPPVLNHPEMLISRPKYTATRILGGEKTGIDPGTEPGNLTRSSDKETKTHSMPSHIPGSVLQLLTSAVSRFKMFR